eukprot:4953134-Karenia_brevis.AAC.1
MSFVGSLDPAHRRVAFLGFPESLPPSERIAKIEKFLEKFSEFHPTATGTFYKGPHNARQPTQTCYVEFADAEVAVAFLNKVKNESLEVNGSDIKFKKALTKVNAARNWALRKAKDLIDDASEGHHKPVKIDWPSRTVKANDVVAFSQIKSQLKGTFHAPFANLSLP